MELGGFEGSRETALTGRDRGAGVGAFLVDRHGTVLGMDRRFEALTGWSAAEVVGRKGGLSLFAEDLTGAAGAPDAPAREIRLVCHDGRVLDVEVSVARFGADGERLTVQVLRVLARTAAAASPRSADDRWDGLTGLPGRTAFLERLEFELEAVRADAEPLGLILADVDGLRRLNDRSGRRAGDSVLLRLAGILRATVGADDLVARFQDDDFAILVPGVGRGTARQLAARVRSTVERARFAGPSGEDLRVTLSLGSASFPADADNPGDLLARAGEALAEARALGRNRVWCYVRRPRVPLRAPVYLEGDEPLLVGYSLDLSPSGIFVSTPSPVEIGMRCALAFPLPTTEGKVHVIGRIVRTVPLVEAGHGLEVRSPGMGIEFERFGPEDRRAIEAFLHANESRTLRPETGIQSV